MADRPIIFSAPMVRALRRGEKTQTRRLIKKPAALDALAVFTPSFLLLPGNVDLLGYAPRDRLWVREAWAPLNALTHNDPGTRALADDGFYRADDGTVAGEISRWHPSIHMPRNASRMTLLVSDVRVQRLQQMSEEDARAEGIYLDRAAHPSLPFCAALPNGDVCRWTSAIGAFAGLWNALHGPKAWGANPWVVALTFEVQQQNIDRLAVAA